MNCFEIIVINMIALTFPVLVWLFYVTYNKNIGKKENELFLDFTIFTILYLIVKFSPTILTSHPLLIVNVPLFLAYMKKRHISIIVISSFIVVYYNYYFDINLLWLIVEYAIYYLIFLGWSKTKYNRYHSLLLMGIIKSIIFLSWVLTSSYFKGVNEILLTKALFLVFLLYISSYFILKLCNKGEEILKFHMTLKELEQEKQIRTSLFKITHEIKNPIAVCKGYLDMFDVNNIDHSKKYIPILREEIERTLILLQDFLCMTKIKMTKDIIDINMVLEDVTDNFIPILKENNIIGEFSISEDSIYMYGDYNRLSQTFINIIKNSIEAADQSKKSIIKIYTKLLDNHIKIYVVDNGVGISKENMERICEPFFTTKCRGTGLGVSLSHEIISGHNGKIVYDSEEGVGTSVEITLPVIKEKRL
jgi:signal transduction histidine kinase